MCEWEDILVDRRKLLTNPIGIIWVLTAVAVLVVLIIHFVRLDRLYDELDRVERQAMLEAGADRTGLAGTGDDRAGADSIETGKDSFTTGVDETPEGRGDSLAETDRTEAGAKGIEGALEEADTASQDPAGAGLTEAQGGGSGEDQDEAANLGAKQLGNRSIDPYKKIIAFSFDDGPSKYTERILKALEKYNARATFFMVGYNIEHSPERVKLIYDYGCEVANHTSDHKSLTEGSAEEIKKRVYDNEDLIKSLVPVERVLVRPPYGSYNDTTRDLIKRPMINWSVDSLDWKSRKADKVVAQIKQDARDGYIILMHDIYESTAEAVERILPWLIDQGYQVTTVSEMYEARGEELLGGHVYRFTKKASEMER